jgi:uncharacterized repeat protein (TIGR03837 family)
MRSSTSLAIFCRVVDNYGDIGICWRLARQMHAEHGVAVTLWVDDLASFRRICPVIDIDQDRQTVDNVVIRHWHTQEATFTAADIADIVIEFFACDIPPGYIAAMAQCTPRPVWLNLEGLTAEEWVEGCHTLPSMHPQLPLTKHFFFPGFTAKTGGLLREASVTDARRGFQANAVEQANFLARFGVTAAEMGATKVSLFCYPQAPVADLLGAWCDGADPVLCLVPEGVAQEAVSAFLGAPATAGAMGQQGSLTVRIVPFVAQPDYDKLLWACDLNFVRGEDSFVRAQWAGKPFIWHIYHQEENLHHVKLRAFLGRYARPGIAAFSLAWNGVDTGSAPDWPALWTAIVDDAAAISARALEWEEEMATHGDLAGNLLGFACSLRARPMI